MSQGHGARLVGRSPLPRDLKKLLDSLDKEITIMHPGPINRGVELSSDAADSHHTIILNQVENGVAIRMAVLYLLASKVA